MANGVPLDHVVARNLRELIDERHAHHGSIAAWMKALGFDWTTNRVAQTVTLRRSLSLAELAGLCNVFEVPLERLLAGDDEIALSGNPDETDGPAQAAPLSEIRAVLRSGELDNPPDEGKGWRPSPSIVSVYVVDEVEPGVAKRLNISLMEVRGLAHHLYENTHVINERNRRTGDLSDLSHGPARAKRGHAMRAILAEMRAQKRIWDAMGQQQQRDPELLDTENDPGLRKSLALLRDRGLLR